MFGLDIMDIGIIALVLVSLAAVVYGVLYSSIEASRKTQDRVRKVQAAETDRLTIKASRDRMAELTKRRKSVQDSLKELEKKQAESDRRKAQTLKGRITQSGLKISVAQFWIFSLALGFSLFLFAFFAGIPLFVAAGIFFVGAFGVPRWFVGFVLKRRMRKFLDEFPNALDVMVRSIKSGLPLNDSLRLIAAESQEPVKTEFRRVVDAQQMGLSVPESVARMYQSIMLQEVNFFAIVIAIQAQAGGNLSEALGNLSRVLRERRKMKAKVSALSMEAKASAVIIGALPFIVSFLVYVTSPAYMMILFTDPRGHLIMGASAIWMTIGIVVMRNMVNFEI
jgi:tight adherence protein B